MALALRLALLRPPAPRPHHARIARALLQDVAQRHDGEVFALGNRDLVLLCRAAPEALALPALLTRLLRPNAPDPAALVAAWRLEDAAGALLDYSVARLADPVAPPVPPSTTATVSPLAIDAAAAALHGAHWPDITTRQIGVLLAGGPAGSATALRPLFCELSLTDATLEARADGAGAAGADPCLFAHLAQRLDAPLLAALADAFAGGGPLDAADPRSPTLHLNLTLPTVLSPAFAALAQRCRDAGRTLGVEVTLVETSADPAGFAAARRRAGAGGWQLVLDGVSHLALLLTRPCAARADLVKLDWSPALLHLPPEEARALAAALSAIGVSRVVLRHAADEAAIRWGCAHGIRRFQGHHVDAMLAASRLLSCPAAADCTLRQCAERGAATGAAGRRFCRRPELLDAGAPPER